ncbi:unnamed protein product [Vitrella brassicaformis CCMP3155]|uniref:Uncharacterized protein n=1 Tax=Vitrella brassicaformis (strain CCMP3155) TaxID=1169540 RepID=A0A0G4FP08_VITBC|nr:unnamed protein product [Vitrella brassicaformis CCMP3155]|eukprot:CEM15931.1 unnamed protein product [Vitrella brassicaformis CCMP3155]
MCGVSNAVTAAASAAGFVPPTAPLIRSRGASPHRQPARTATSAMPEALGALSGVTNLMSEVVEVEGGGSAILNLDLLETGMINLAIAWVLFYNFVWKAIVNNNRNIEREKVKEFAEDEKAAADVAREIYAHNQGIDSLDEKMQQLKTALAAKGGKMVETAREDFTTALDKFTASEEANVKEHAKQIVTAREDIKVGKALEEVVKQKLLQRRLLLKLRAASGSKELDPFMASLNVYDPGLPDWALTSKYLGFHQQFATPPATDIAVNDVVLRALAKMQAKKEGRADDEQVLLNKALRSVVAANAFEKSLAD